MRRFAGIFKIALVTVALIPALINVARIKIAGMLIAVLFYLSGSIIVFAANATELVDGDTVVIAFGAEATQVDPTRSTAGVDAYFTDLFFEQLLQTTPELEQVNWLAQSWEVVTEAGKTRIDVTLRQGVKFHNGDVLTAQDIEYAYQRQSDPASGMASRLRYVSEFELHDDHRFSVHLSQPDGSIVVQNLILYAIPRKYYQQVGDEGVLAHPIGTGPWKFVSRKPRDEIVLERFEDYWNPAASPGFKRLVIKIIPEDTTRVAAYKTGAVDWIDAVPPAQIASFSQIPNTVLITLPAPNNLFLNLNSIDAASPFRDVRVRKAIALAVDYDAIIKYILFGQGIRTAQLAPGSIGYDPSLAPYPYDPEKARELLKEAGYPAGLNINCYNLTTPREPYIKEVGETIYAYLAESGIRCKIIQMEYGAWINLGRYNTRPWMDGLQSTMWGQGLPGDPTDAWGGHLHSNGDSWGSYSYTSDPEIDILIEQLRSSMDDGDRALMIQNIARLKHQRLAGGVPTYRPKLTFAWRDSIDFKPWPGAFWRSMRQISPCPDRNCSAK